MLRHWLLPRDPLCAETDDSDVDAVLAQAHCQPDQTMG
jgi:hypothetical protein